MVTIWHEDIFIIVSISEEASIFPQVYLPVIDLWVTSHLIYLFIWF